MKTMSLWRPTLNHSRKKGHDHTTSYLGKLHDTGQTYIGSPQYAYEVGVNEINSKHCSCALSS